MAKHVFKELLGDFTGGVMQTSLAANNTDWGIWRSETKVCSAQCGVVDHASGIGRDRLSIGGGREYGGGST